MMIFVIPNPDKTIIDPVTQRPLPEEGMEVPFNKYWIRRIDEGDVHIKPESDNKKSNAKKEA